MSQKKKKEKYPVTVSDWIVFLESNASSNISLYVLLGTILIALAITVVNFDKLDLDFIIYTVFLVIVMVIIIARLKHGSDRIKLYQRLSQKIVLGEITDPEDIKEEYKKFMKKI